MLSVTLKIFPKCITEMYNSKVIKSQGCDSGANAPRFLEHLISSGVAESAAGISRRNKRVFFQPWFCFLLYLKIARGHSREGPSVFQHCSKMSVLGGRFHTARRACNSMQENGNRPSGKGICFFEGVTRLGKEHLLGIIQSAAGWLRNETRLGAR